MTETTLQDPIFTWESIFDSGCTLKITEKYDNGAPRNGKIIIGDRSFEILNGIPRLVPTQEYASNFGLQWNTFRLTQLDSYTKLPLTFNRFWNNTKWKPGELYGKTVLEAGSGAGRFTEVLLEAGAKVVSFDLSNAVEANFSTNSRKGDLLLFQASIYDLPLKDNYFDYVFCHGVLQHTPEPEKAYQMLYRKLKPGGSISIDYYLRTNAWVPWSKPKYFWRPLTTRMQPERLLKIIKSYIPFWLPLDTVLRSIPGIGGRLSAMTLIPCWNYYYLALPKKEKVQWAIMDTFDALAARYDFPKTLEEVKQMVKNVGADHVDVFYGGNGVVANAEKPRT